MLDNVLRDIFSKEWFIKTGDNGYFIRFEENDNQIKMISRDNKILTFADKYTFKVANMSKNVVILKGIKTNLEGSYPITWHLHENEELYKIYKEENKLFNKIKRGVK